MTYVLGATDNITPLKGPTSVLNKLWPSNKSDGCGYPGRYYHTLRHKRNINYLVLQTAKSKWTYNKWDKKRWLRSYLVYRDMKPGGYYHNHPSYKCVHQCYMVTQSKDRVGIHVQYFDPTYRYKYRPEPPRYGTLYISLHKKQVNVFKNNKRIYVGTARLIYL